jgi:hypothetical protein
MEEVTLEKLVSNYKFQQTKYFASYDIEGNIISISSAKNKNLNNIIEIESNLAESIISGKASIFSYKVDCSALTVYENIQNNPVIHYSLHRIGQDTWSKITNPDIKILCNTLENSLVFKLSTEFKNLKECESYKLTFYITDYNNPDSLRNVVTINFLDLIKNEILFEEIDLSDKFSIFTKPLFKYTLTII